MARYDLLMQNTANKREYLIHGLKDTSDSGLAYVFEDFEMPEGAEDGEYLCALFRNGRRDAEYTMSDDLLETEIATEEGTVKVKDLRAEVFILKFGDIETPYVARQKNNEYYYYNG